MTLLSIVLFLSILESIQAKGLRSLSPLIQFEPEVTEEGK